MICPQTITGGNLPSIYPLAASFPHHRKYRPYRYKHPRPLLPANTHLYTVRMVLATLGAEDYGIYNVVAGVVVLFSFLNGAMTSATQRFLNYALGQNNTEEARDVYSLSFMLYAFISLFVIILAETVGLWFLQTRLNIPAGRKDAKNRIPQR